MTLYSIGAEWYSPTGYFCEVAEPDGGRKMSVVILLPWTSLYNVVKGLWIAMVDAVCFDS